MKTISAFDSKWLLKHLIACQTELAAGRIITAKVYIDIAVRDALGMFVVADTQVEPIEAPVEREAA